MLVLTHTNAGRCALENRLANDRASCGPYRVATIDSWLLRTTAAFPVRASVDRACLLLQDKDRDYPLVRQAANRLLASGDIAESLEATYSRVLVDEYQDCSHAQHSVITELSKVVPTCVLGDPQQSIFGFKEATVDWEADVLATFPSVGTLEEPWRWKRVGCDRLGRWLRSCRDSLAAGEPVDLRKASKDHVRWMRHDASTAIAVRQKAAACRPPKSDWSTLVLADSARPHSHKKLAMRTPGLVTVEALEMDDLREFAQTFDIAAPEAVTEFLRFVGQLMAHLDVARLLRRLETLTRSRAHKEPEAHELALLAFEEERTFSTALEALRACRNAPDVRIYRPEVFRGLVSALQRTLTDNCSFAQATAAAIEANRHIGRPMTRRAVGSTLLLKGLESDVAVILNPAVMDAHHLYVALTRGSRSLVVCSDTPVLTPAQKR